VQVGEVLAAKYRVERVLAVGGMGMVVAAMHLQLEQRVALKFMLPQVLDTWGASERFSREARAAARLKSEHVARILDVDVLDSGSPYIVMEYLEGTDLFEILQRDGPLSAGTAADYIIQALDAIAEAHALGIVHRDLKPDNLFVTRRADGSAWVKVLDFGISKAAPGPGNVQLTHTQAVVGTPRYMSPEQMRSTRLADARSDIWSLGVILYELVSGRVPFAGEVFSELVLKVAMDPLEPMAAPWPVSGEFEAVVRRCLEKEPAHRFQNVAELAAALAPFAPASAWPIAERIRNLWGHRSHTVALAAEPSSPWPANEAAAAATAPYAPGQERQLVGSAGAGANAAAYPPVPGLTRALNQPTTPIPAPARARGSGRTIVLATVIGVAAVGGIMLAALGVGGESGPTDGKPAAAEPSVTVPEGASSPEPTAPAAPSVTDEAASSGQTPPEAGSNAVATPGAAQPETAPSETAATETAPSETAPAEVTATETAPPETAPPETAPPAAREPASTSRPHRRRSRRSRRSVKPEPRSERETERPEPADPLADPE
jgi:eukaryotic-like serine/threonine-protein kinase